jgi:predicted ribosome quality control (RQC) complex YloA/Tae2 family protein
MSLTARELEQVVAELGPLAGSRVDAVRVHAERALTLELHGRGGEALLLLSAEPELARLHAATARPPQPETPFGWQGLLRQQLEGARLEAIERPAERVVTLRFARAGGEVRLVAELGGRASQLFLLDAAGVVRGAPGRIDAGRGLAVGLPWRPDPRGGSAGPDRPTRFAAGGEGPFPVSRAIEAHYAAVEAERRLLEARRRLREPLRAAVARGRRTLEKLDEELARIPAAEQDRRLGDLLKANLQRVKRGQREVTLTAWSERGEERVRVALDPALSPRENMERFYKRFRRITESAARVEARAAEVRDRLERTTALLGQVDGCPAAELPRLEREARALSAGPRPPPRPRRRRDAPRPCYRTFHSVSGLPLLVGRGAEENDQLTTRVARGNDPWLHVRGQAGAHVVIRPAGREVDQEALIDAAHLAAHFSDARGEPQVEVACTRAKYVRKARGAAPGAVTISQEKMIHLRVEPPRLARLLADEEEGAP